MKIFLSSSGGIQASKIFSALYKRIVGREKLEVRFVGTSKLPSYDYRSIWSLDCTRKTSPSDNSDIIFVLNEYTEDVNAHYDCAGRAYDHARNIENFINADIKHFGSDSERMKRHGRYQSIIGRDYPETLSTISSILKEDANCRSRNDSDPKWISFGKSVSVSSSIEKFVAGRALTSPILIDSFHGGRLDRSSVLLDCIQAVAKSVIDNDRFVSEVTNDVRSGEVSLNDFRDMFFESALERNSISLAVEDLPDVPACMISVGNSRKIYRDKSLNGFERSFAVAHELAHFSFRDSCYIETEFGNDGSGIHLLQEYRSDQFANILLRSIEGIFVLLGGKSAQRDYAKGMIDLAAGKRLLKRELVSRSASTEKPSKAHSRGANFDQPLPDKEFVS